MRASRATASALAAAKAGLAAMMLVRLQKVCTERAEENRAERGQHMVGPGEVVAEGLRRVGAEEDRARMADTGQHGPRLAHQHFEVLRGHAVGEGDGGVHVRHEDHGAPVGQRFAHDVGTGQGG